MPKCREGIAKTGSFHVQVTTIDQVCEFDGCFAPGRESLRGNAFVSRKLNLDKLGQSSIAAIGRVAMIRDGSQVRQFEYDRLLYLRNEHLGLNVVFDLFPERWLKHGRFGDMLQFLDKFCEPNSHALEVRTKGDIIQVSGVVHKEKDTGQRMEYEFKRIGDGFVLRKFLLDSGFIAPDVPGPVYRTEMSWSQCGTSFVPAKITEWQYVHNEVASQPAFVAIFTGFKTELPSEEQFECIPANLPVGTVETIVLDGAVGSSVAGGKDGELQHALTTNSFDIQVKKGVHSR